MSEFPAAAGRRGRHRRWMGAAALTAALTTAVAMLLGGIGPAGYAATGPAAAKPGASAPSAPAPAPETTPARASSPAPGRSSADGPAAKPEQPQKPAKPGTGSASTKKSAAPSTQKVEALRAKASMRAAAAAPAGDTDAADCGGPLAFDTVHACDSITDGGSDTYTLTTSAADDLLTIQLTQTSGATVTGQLTGPDDTVVDCSITGWVGPASCATGAAGTYSLTVSDSYGSGGYTLAVSSLNSSPCTTLTESDLAFGSAPLTGSIAAGGASSCYALGSGAGSGDLLRMTGLSYEVQATVYDATATAVCSAGSSGDTCTLSGTGPYRMVLRDTYAQAVSYSVTVNRLSHPAGCATLAAAPFGDPGGSVASGSLPAGGADCRTITLPDGPVMISLRGGASTSGSTSWSLVTSQGQQICAGADDGTCGSLPAAGTYTLLLENTSPFGPADYSIAAVPLTGTKGCAAAAGTAYDLPLLHATLGSPVQTDCQAFDGAAGDRIDLAATTDVYGDVVTSIVGPAGTASCSSDTGDGPDQDGCVLTGTGPYRVITRSTYDFTGAYTMRIARLSDPAGCKALSPQSYGVAPAASADPCWLLQVPAAGTYDVGGTQVYHLDGTRFCSAGIATCTFPAAGTYAMVFRPDHLDGRTFSPTFVSPSQTAGCTATSDTGFVTGPASVELAGQGQRDCLLLPTASGKGLYLVATPSADGRNTAETVYDSHGAQQCQSSYSFGVCKLTGTAPFHLVLTAPATGVYRLTVQRTGDTGGCTTWPLSSFGGSTGTPVQLTATRQTVCLGLPANGHTTAEMFDFTNTENRVNASVRVYDAAGDQVCGSVTSSVATCRFTAGVGYTAVLVGTGGADTYHVVHRDVSQTATCGTPRSLTMGGASTGYAFASAMDSRCLRVKATGTDKLWFSVRTPGASPPSGADLLVFDASGTIVCRQYGVACRDTGSTSYLVAVLASGFSGRPIVAHVDTWRVGTASGWAPQCTANVLSPEGFPLRRGTLTQTTTAFCAVMDVKPWQAFDVYGTHGDPTAAAPTVNMFSSADWNGTSLDYAYQCSGSGDFTFRCSVSGGAPAAQVVFVLSAAESAAPTDYVMQGVCSSSCSTPQQTADVTSVMPASGPAEAENQVVLHGTGLTLGTEVGLAKDGSAASAYTMARAVSVSSDGTSLTVLLDTHGIGPGSYDVLLDDHGYTVGTRSPGYLPDGYTVTAATTASRAQA